MRMILLLAVSILLSACMETGDPTGLPKYDQDVSLKFLTSNSGVTDKPDHVVTIRVYRSLDPIEKVSPWYKSQLAGKPGWKGPVPIGPDKLLWTDGNIQFLEGPMNDFKPRDPKKPGGMVLLDRFKEGGESKDPGFTVIYLVRSEPKTAH